MLVAILLHNLAAFANGISAIEDICACQATQKTIAMTTEWTPMTAECLLVMIAPGMSSSHMASMIRLFYFIHGHVQRTCRIIV